MEYASLDLYTREDLSKDTPQYFFEIHCYLADVGLDRKQVKDSLYELIKNEFLEIDNLFFSFSPVLLQVIGGDEIFYKPTASSDNN